MKAVFSRIWASCTERTAHCLAYSSRHSMHFPQGSWKVAYSLLIVLVDQASVVPSAWKPTVNGDVHCTACPFLFLKSNSAPEFSRIQSVDLMNPCVFLEYLARFTARHLFTPHLWPPHPCLTQCRVSLGLITTRELIRPDLFQLHCFHNMLRRI